ncbi:MAG: DUF4058 family protein [Chloroflexi bacterium]|nr:DUF4058 family protein [Chloroflexota bacterium]
MRSPFPGMDPYLEDPDGWRGFHARLIVTISDQLTARVAPNFIVDIEERVDIIEFGVPNKRFIEPDTYVISKPVRKLREAAIGTITPATLVEPFSTERVVERYIELRDAKTREVVTVIEVLSPTNKAEGKGSETFQNKREKVMHSNAHWIEIDLLRGGERFKLVAGQSDYIALLKRAHIEHPYEVWFFNLRDKMPTIAVPLRPPFQDVPLDLQVAFDVTYERARYADSVDYAVEPPPPPLREEDAAWVRERVREWMNARRKELPADRQSG